MKKTVYLLLTGSFIALLVLMLYELGLLLIIARVLGLSIVLVLIILLAGLFLVFLIAVPYYLIKKKPKTEEYGNYRLEDFKE
ncbi:MAG: hypothetical protein R6W73_03280 [Candidatus Saliniplasma sp.]